MHSEVKLHLFFSEKHEPLILRMRMCLHYYFQFLHCQSLLLIFPTAPIDICKAFKNDIEWVLSKKRHLMPIISSMLSVGSFEY